MPRHLLDLQSVQLLLLQCDRLFFICVIFRDISWLMLRGKIIDVYSENHTKHTIHCDKMRSF